MLKMYHHASAGSSAEYWEQNWSQSNLEHSIRGCESDPLRGLWERYAWPGARMLEGGCGMGHYVLYHSARGVKVVGLDFAQQTLSRLRERGPHLSLCVGDVFALPLRDSSFDLYYSGGVVEHFEAGPERPLQEARRILKPGGILLVSVPYYSPLRRMLRPFKRGWRSVAGAALDPAERRNGVTFFQYCFRKEEFIPLLEAAGFRLVEARGISVLWGMYDLPVVSTLVAKLIARIAPRDVPRAPAETVSVSAPAAPRGRFRSTLKRVAISEDDRVPVLGYVVRALRWGCANMMMYVCVAEDRPASAPNATAAATREYQNV